MRIVGGQFGGRRLVAPPGRATRPTADRTREAMFNVLAHGLGIAIDGARVIDLFAGSGALGLEALSRGAAFALFVETDSGARGAIRDNAEALGLSGRVRLHRRSATALGARPAGLGAAFDLAFLDPPYARDLAAPALAGLAAGGWMAPDAAAIVEQGARERPVEAEGWEEIDRRRYGEAQIGVYRFAPAAPARTPPTGSP